MSSSIQFPTLSRSRYPPPLNFQNASPNSVDHKRSILFPMPNLDVQFKRYNVDDDAMDDPSRSLSPVPDDNNHFTPRSPSTTSFPHPLSAPHSQGHFSNSYLPVPPSNSNSIGSEMNRNPSLHHSHRYIRNGTHAWDKYSLPSSLLDQRRMSEPSIFGSSGSAQSSAYPNPATDASSGRYHQMQFAFNPPPQSPTSPGYPSSLHRGGSLGSLRDQPSPPWKTEDDMQLPLHPYSSLDEPISPLNPNFSGGAHSPTLALSNHGYPNIPDDLYGPSPPGTGTSTTSSNPPGNRREGANGKTYSFVALPGNAVKKRPRRRYDEIERLYQCSWPDCTKAYGTLNHLNAHVTMQKHGPKRSPTEFKELRKQWRKAKKEEEVIRTHQTAIYHGGRRAGYDSDFYYTHYRHHHPYHSSHHLPTIGPDGRYASMTLDSLRYPPADDLDGLPRGHGAEDAFRRGSHPNLRAQARYHSGAAHGSWHPSMGSSRQAHYGHSSQMNLSAGLPANADISLNRLGPDSTLLTPLPGYEPPPLSQVESGLNVYGGPANGHYTDDGSSRPDTGHRSLYDDGRPSTSHGSLYGDDRPSTGHTSLYDDRPGTGRTSLYDDRPGTGHTSLYDDRPGTGHRSLYDEGRPGTGHGSDRGADFRHLG